MNVSETTKRATINPFAAPADPAAAVLEPESAAEACTIAGLLARAEACTPKTKALASSIRLDLDRLRGIVERAEAKGHALRQIAALQSRLTLLNGQVADLDAEEAADEAEHPSPGTPATPAAEAEETVQKSRSPELRALLANKALFKKYTHSSEIRAWALEAGLSVAANGRGRLSNSVIEAWIKAHPGQAAPNA